MVLGITGVGIAFWSIDRFVPGAHDVLTQIPTVALQAINDLQAWWLAA